LSAKESKMGAAVVRVLARLFPLLLRLGVETAAASAISLGLSKWAEGDKSGGWSALTQGFGKADEAAAKSPDPTLRQEYVALRNELFGSANLSDEYSKAQKDGALWGKNDMNEAELHSASSVILAMEDDVTLVARVLHRGSGPVELRNTLVTLEAIERLLRAPAGQVKDIVESMARRGSRG